MEPAPSLGPVPFFCKFHGPLGQRGQEVVASSISFGGRASQWSS